MFKKNADFVRITQLRRNLREIFKEISETLRTHVWNILMEILWKFQHNFWKQLQKL